jgi:hypothetical protein
MAKHVQNTDLMETWNIDSDNEIWVLKEDASIEVGDNIGEEFGIHVADGMMSNRIDVRGDVTATGPIGKAAISLVGAGNTLNVFETSTLTGTNGILSTAYNTRIHNQGTIDGSLNGIHTQFAKEVINSGDISGKIGIHDIGGARIVNSGKIDGTVDGILAETSEFTIINGKGGEISGGEAGIRLDTDEARVVNHGKIIDGQATYSLKDGDGTLTLINRGTIEGQVHMGGGNDVFDTRGGTFDYAAVGGLGDDVYKTSFTDLNIAEYANGGRDEVMSSASFELGDNVENLTLLGKGDIDGEGNELANTLVGNKGDNDLSGGDGDFDTLSGGAGRDILGGGAGDDFFFFRKNSDIEIVRDFSDGDRIEIDFLEAYQLDNLFAKHLEQKGDNLVIAYGDDKLILRDTDLNELSQDDFIFV